MSAVAKITEARLSDEVTKTKRELTDEVMAIYTDGERLYSVPAEATLVGYYDRRITARRLFTDARFASTDKKKG